MPTIVNPSSGDMPEVPDSLYRARVVKVTPVSLDTPDKFGKTEKLDITVEFEVGGEIVSLDPRVNRAWSEKATLFVIAQACGLDPNPFESFDADELLGREVNILTEQEDGKWPRVKAWQRVRGKAQPAASRPSTGASSTPALILPSGEVDWTTYWAHARKVGVTREMFAGELGDLNKLPSLEPTEAVGLLEILAARLQPV